jgi:hypothetical protein
MLLQRSFEHILVRSEINFLPMRLGPGKHLKGRSIMGGIVKPEEFDYFHEVHSFLRRLKALYSFLSSS